jgi:hypothetical protein
MAAEQGYLWLVTKESVRGFTLSSRQRIEADVRAAVEALTEPSRVVDGETVAARQLRIEQSRRAFDKAAAALSATLIRPGASHRSYPKKWTSLPRRRT